MKTIGSLFTLAGETLSAIGRMIERPGFNDEAAEAYLSESAVINKATADTLRASMGRMESDGPDAADVLARTGDSDALLTASAKVAASAKKVAKAAKGAKK